jgi:hypothetical protein
MFSRPKLSEVMINIIICRDCCALDLNENRLEKASVAEFSSSHRDYF